MKTELFDYDLPPEFIAQHPAQKRDESKLLVLDRASGLIQHKAFANLIEYLQDGDVLVINNTRVIRARLFGTRKTGGSVELLLIRPSRHDVRAGAWEAMLNARGRLLDGEVITFDGGLSAELLGRDASGVSLVKLIHSGDLSSLLDSIGRMPLPPYIKRQKSSTDYSSEDADRYQTVYAKEPGAVAAPTAGLHFTDELMRNIEARGVRIAPLTLHVGPGTFKPVLVDEVAAHSVDPEYFCLTAESATIINSARRVVAVGTTSCRVLETLADNYGKVHPQSGWTKLFIYPPYEFKCVDALITNFHLPRSSLLMLVSAFAGREAVLNAYEEAKRNGYRFYSYGDAMLIT